MTCRPIFVIGVGRSGTTLVRLMLHNHPRLAIPYESHFIGRFYADLPKYGDLDRDDNLRLLVQHILDEPLLKMWDHPFDVDEVVRSVGERTLAGVLDAIYMAYARGHNKARWGDKSDYLDDLPIINCLFPNAQFIHVIRDGRDVARSVIKLDWGPKDMIAAAQWWNDYVWLGHRLGTVIGSERYMEVHFERIVQDPAGELRRVCSFLNEEYAPQMLEYYKTSPRAIPDQRKYQHYNTDGPPEASRAFSWKREMKKADVALFNRYGGRMLRELGYEVPDIRVSKVRLGWRMLRHLTARTLSKATS